MNAITHLPHSLDLMHSLFESARSAVFSLVNFSMSNMLHVINALRLGTALAEVMSIVNILQQKVIFYATLHKKKTVALLLFYFIFKTLYSKRRAVRSVQAKTTNVLVWNNVTVPESARANVEERQVKINAIQRSISNPLNQLCPVCKLSLNTCIQSGTCGLGMREFTAQCNREIDDHLLAVQLVERKPKPDMNLGDVFTISPEDSFFDFEYEIVEEQEIPDTRPLADQTVRLAETTLVTLRPSVAFMGFKVPDCLKWFVLPTLDAQSRDLFIYKEHLRSMRKSLVTNDQKALLISSIRTNASLPAVVPGLFEKRVFPHRDALWFSRAILENQISHDYKDF